ncbi:glycoside hydrolase family 16 protein [Allocoleopsis franciscana]|uniref:Beta-glucanase/beta-glucan synthetase n=1 Tax=Allocoleopsis franciscana PCC 7113 TaxID=1173027 RepID=K9W8N6_9CYAN|nr:glycoside hydrolase family 16 protein [Allocoleopsis franciscana]AFZ16166.1 beta-glucanase/beta-glucan synthetase [Allocoleopsis franciscana PCC 7113]
MPFILSNKIRYLGLLLVLSLLMVLIINTPLIAQSKPSSIQPNWTLIWSDEFNGTSVDTTKWNIIDRIGDINNELHYNTPDAVSVSDGYLVIKSDKVDLGGRAYISGKINTRGKFDFTYGRVEICSQQAATQGLLSAEWLLHYQDTGDSASQYWPPEFDVVEVLGKDSSTAYQSVHYGICYHCRWPSKASSTTKINGSNFTSKFHIFALEWEPTEIRWYIDGRLTKAWTTPITTDDPPIIDEPMQIILGTAVGGNWPGSPDTTTVFPAYHYVDYVRVYQRTARSR